jgi:hypothetical protein
LRIPALAKGTRWRFSHPRLRRKAFIAETPYDDEGDDERNVQALIGLSRAKSNGVTARPARPVPKAVDRRR